MYLAHGNSMTNAYHPVKITVAYNPLDQNNWIFVKPEKSKKNMAIPCSVAQQTAVYWKTAQTMPTLYGSCVVSLSSIEFKEYCEAWKTFRKTQ